MKTSQTYFRMGIFTACLFTLFFGCALGPDFVPPSPQTPDRYRFETTPAEIAVNLKWWELFDDPVLYELVTLALENNRDIKIAAYRIEEARAALGFNKADQYPRVDAEADARTGNFLGGSRNRTTDKSAFIAPVLSWEIDFWGKFRRATESAQAQLIASQYAFRTIQLSLLSEVAGTYYLLLDYYNRRHISEQTLSSRLKSLDIIQQRFDEGILPELDLNQAQIQKEIAASSIPLYERLVAQTENALSILLGKLPGEIRRGEGLNFQVIPPAIPAGVPATLLERRPDVAESLFLLHAQTAQIGVAEALRLPAVSLTGLLGVASNEISDITIDGDAWRIGGSLTGPLFDFGKNLRRVEIEEARTKQALYGYENTVLRAFREVEDALVEIETYKRQVASVSNQVKAARNANELSNERYDKGVTSYLEVLETERQLFAAQLDLSELRQQYLNAYVKLYKALGGGWMTKEEERRAYRNTISKEPDDGSKSWFRQ